LLYGALECVRRTFSRAELCGTPAKKKKKKNAGICGRVAVRGQLLRNFESAGECGSPARNKNRSRHVFIIVSARTCDVTSCYNTVLGDFFKVQSTLSSRFHYNKQRNDSSNGRYSNPPPEVIRIHHICTRAQGSGKGSRARCSVDNH
jgi:hypothetical protein